MGRTTAGRAYKDAGQHPYSFFERHKATALDGTTFTPAIFYCVATRNIGIVMQTPDGPPVAYTDTLYANPNIAGMNAQRMAERRNSLLSCEPKSKGEMV